MRKHTGFTLVEIAIVLVIIGLLLGGVLKGQELVVNAQAKSIANDLKGIQSLIYGYQDRFKALPGDDALVATHVVGGTAATPAATLGNGRIDGGWNTSVQTAESYLFWQHVRLAGFAAGSTAPAAATYRPLNAQGGALGVTGVNAANQGPIQNLQGTYFACANNINGRLASIVDSNLDDGVSNTGAVRITNNQVTGTVVFNAAPVAPNVVLANPNNQYTICMAF